MEAARSRFEDKLEAEKSKNKKSLEEYNQYLSEANKFCELKALKDTQKKVWVKNVLEKQMEQDNRKRLESQVKRREKTEMTFGPKETEE